MSLNTAYSVKHQAPSPKHDTCHPDIEWGKDASDLTWRSLQASLYTFYKEVSETKLLPLIMKMTKKSDHVFQQNEAPSHTAKTVRELLGINFWLKDFGLHSHHIWTPSTAASLWMHSEKTACKIHHSNTDELKASENRAWRSMKHDFVGKDCKRFRPRLVRVTAVKNHHIE